jgi:spermidine/putrescine transport system permease protein
LIATVLGTASAVGIDRFKKGPARSGIMAVTNIPMMNPEIVTGISMMLLFVFVGRLVKTDSVLGFFDFFYDSDLHKFDTSFLIK